MHNQLVDELMDARMATCMAWWGWVAQMDRRTYRQMGWVSGWVDKKVHGLVGG